MKILDLLRAYEPKALVKGKYHDGSYGCCVLGACVPALRDVHDDNNSEPVRKLNFRLSVVGAGLRDAELRVDEAENLQQVNDGLWLTPVERYATMLQLLECVAAEKWTTHEARRKLLDDGQDAFVRELAERGRATPETL